MKKILFAILLGVCASASAAVLVDTGNVATLNAETTSVALSTTIGASDNVLVLMCNQWNTMEMFAAAPTFNGVSLTKLASQYDVGNGVGSESQEAWGLVSPTVGTFNVTATVNSSADNLICAAVPMSGAALTSTFGTPAYYPGTAASGSVSITATGATSTGLYIGEGFTFAAMTTGGAPMVNLFTVSGGSTPASVDYVPGTSAGTFAYNSATASIAILAIAVLPASGASAPVQGGFALSPSN